MSVILSTVQNVRRQISQTFNWMGNYIQSVKNRSLRYSRWIVSNVSAFISNMGQHIAQGFLRASHAITALLSNLPRQIIEGVLFGYRLASHLVSFIISGRLLRGLIRFLRAIPPLLFDLFNFFKDLALNLYRFTRFVLIGIKNITIEIIKDIFLFARFIISLIRPLITETACFIFRLLCNLPEYLTLLGRLTVELIYLLKDAAVFIARNTFNLIRTIANALLPLCIDLIKNTLRACRWLVSTVFTGIGIVIGTIFGIAAAIFDLFRSLFVPETRRNHSVSNALFSEKKNEPSLSAVEFPSMTFQFQCYAHDGNKLFKHKSKLKTQKESVTKCTAK